MYANKLIQDTRVGTRANNWHQCLIIGYNRELVGQTQAPSVFKHWHAICIGCEAVCQPSFISTSSSMPPCNTLTSIKQTSSKYQIPNQSTGHIHGTLILLHMSLYVLATTRHTIPYLQCTMSCVSMYVHTYMYKMHILRSIPLTQYMPILIGCLKDVQHIHYIS